MTLIKIKIENCEPNDKAPHASRKQLDKIEWKNHDEADHVIQFSLLPGPIFKGYGNQPRLPVPANGSIEVELLEDAPVGTHDYSITGAGCQAETDPGAIVIDP